MRNAPKSNVVFVILGSLGLLSALMYYVQMQNHDNLKRKLYSQVTENLGPKNGGSQYTEDLFDVVYGRYVDQYKQNNPKEANRHISKQKMMADPQFLSICKQVGWEDGVCMCVYWSMAG